LEKAESELGREKIKSIEILTDINKIKPLLEETDEALSLLIKRGTPPLYGIYNLESELKRLDIGGHLTPGSLLKISDSLRVVRSLKDYRSEEHTSELQSRFDFVCRLLLEKK